MDFCLDINKRADNILHEICEIDLGRVGTIALPLLSLNSKTSFVASVGIVAYQVGSRSSQIYTKYHTLTWGAFSYELLELTLLVSSVALNVFLPVFSNVFHLTWHCGDFAKHVYRLELKNAAIDLLKIGHQVVYICAFYYGTTIWIACSLLSQGALELYQAVQFYQDKTFSEGTPCLLQGRKLEALTYLGLSILRGWKAYDRFFYGLTQEQWHEICGELRMRKCTSRETPIISDNFFIERGVSPVIDGINFDATELNGLHFERLVFNKCKFGFISDSSFEDITFNQCNLQKTRWINSIFRNVQILNSNCSNLFFYRGTIDNVTVKASVFFESVFLNSNLEGFRAEGCDFSYACFNDSVLKQPAFIKSKLFETSFLHAEVQDGRLEKCDLTDALLVDAKEQFDIQGGVPHHMTRPVIAMGWDFDNRGVYTPKIVTVLRKNGAILLIYEQNPAVISRSELKTEVRTNLVQYSDELSIAQSMLSQAPKNSLIDKVRQRAAATLKYCQGNAIPGGKHIEPEFYGVGSMQSSKIKKRTIIELAMLEYAHENKIPTLGICRGAQMINVFFGGTLKNVSGQIGSSFMEFVDSPHGKWLHQLTGGSLLTHSHHQQAADKIGQGLHVIMKRGDVPKMLVNEDGTFIACQVHPECYDNMASDSAKNKGIYEEFIMRARQFSAVHKKI